MAFDESRRGLLVVVGAGLAGALAGCTDTGDPDPGSTTTASAATEETPTTTGTTSTATTDSTTASTTEGGGSYDGGVPTPTFSYDYDEDAGEVTITHVDGDPFPADRLTVVIGGEPADRQFSDVTDTVRPDVSVAVSADPGETVELRFDAGGETRVIGLFDVPP